MFKKIKKPVVTMIILGLIIPSFYLLSIRPSEATDGGGSWAEFFQNQLINFVLKPLMRQLAYRLLNTYTTGIVDQINNNGRTRNSTGFVDIWRNFLTEAQYRGEDVFRNILANTNLCGDVAPGARSTFNTRPAQPLTQNIRTNNLDPFTLRARCTMPQGWLIRDFKADFSGNGGWGALVRLSEPQNNSFGSLMLSLGELAAQRTLDQHTDNAEIVAGKGFTGTRASCTLAATCNNGHCSNNPMNLCRPGNNNDCAEIATTARCSFLGQTLTPANVIGEASAKFIDTKLDWVISSQDVVSILLNAFNGIVNNLTNYRRQPRREDPVQNPVGDNYQQCVRACANFPGQAYMDCMERCANEAGVVTPGNPEPTPTPTPTPVPTPTPTPSPNDDILSPNEVLTLGNHITSATGEYQFEFQASDGNLVLYRMSDGSVVWQAGIGGLGGVELIMQQIDGNLVLYNSSGVGIWSSGTQGNPDAYFVVQNGNIVIYPSAGTPALWSRP